MRPPLPRPFRRPALLLCALLLLGALGTPRAARADDPPAPTPGTLVLEKEVQDYGVVDQDSEYTAEVGYRNGGAQAIHGLRVQADCGCYAVALSATELEPGAAGTLTVRFRTFSFRGAASKTVRLLYEDGAPRIAELELKLDVVGGVLVERLHLGEVLAGTLPSGEVPLLWYEGVGQPFEVQSVELPGEPVEAKVEPYVPGPGSRYRGWRIRLQFKRPPPRGIYSRKAVVHTTHPLQKRVLIPVTANVVGKVWVQTSRVYLGLVPQGTPKSAAVTVRGFSPEVRLGRVSARSRGGKVQVRLEDAMGPAGPAKRLVVSVPADAPEGSLDDVVELHTEVPGEELVTVEVRGRVFAAARR